MPTTFEGIKEKAAQLSELDRAELALALIESLDGPADANVEEAWRIEAERRLAQIERGEVQLIPGDEPRAIRAPCCSISPCSGSRLFPNLPFKLFDATLKFTNTLVERLRSRHRASQRAD